MANNIVPYLKERGHGWVVVLTVIIIIGYIFYANANDLPQSQLLANSILVLVATLTSLFALVSLIIVALIKKSEMGELKDLVFQLTLGLFVGLAFSLIGLLNLFGILKLIG